MSAPQHIGIAEQVKLSFQVTTRVPAIVGAVFGGIVPGLAFLFSHFGPHDLTWRGYVCAVFVALCLAYSVPKVVAWGDAVFKTPVESWAFALLMEGAMTLGSYLGGVAFTVASCVCLCVLVVVNALSTACSAALRQRSVNEARRAARDSNPDTLSLAGGDTWTDHAQKVVHLGTTRTQLQAGPPPAKAPRRSAPRKAVKRSTKRKAGGA